MTTYSALEALDAVNSFVPFCTEDQESMLSVIQDYFTSPSCDKVDDDYDSEDESIGKNISIMITRYSS